MAVLTVFLLAVAAFAPKAHSASARGDDDASLMDDREYKFIIGTVTEDQGWRLLVNESERVVISSETRLLNEREREVGRGSIKSGKWIYLEGPVGRDGAVEAEKVYLLPGPVKSKDYRKYPFINIAPVPWRQ